MERLRVPSRKSHNYFSQLVFGDSYDKVHAYIDGPYKWLGRKHRRLYHTQKEAFTIGLMLTGTASGGLAGAAHVLLDSECSENKELKKILETQEKQDAKEKKNFQKFIKKLKKTKK